MADNRVALQGAKRNSRVQKLTANADGIEPVTFEKRAKIFGHCSASGTILAQVGLQSALYLLCQLLVRCHVHSARLHCGLVVCVDTCGPASVFGTRAWANAAHRVMSACWKSQLMNFAVAKSARPLRLVVRTVRDPSTFANRQVRGAWLTLYLCIVQDVQLHKPHGCPFVLVDFHPSVTLNSFRFAPNSIKAPAHGKMSLCSYRSCLLQRSGRKDMAKQSIDCYCVRLAPPCARKV